MYKYNNGCSTNDPRPAPCMPILIQYMRTHLNSHEMGSLFFYAFIEVNGGKFGRVHTHKQKTQPPPYHM